MNIFNACRVFFSLAYLSFFDLSIRLSCVIASSPLSSCIFAFLLLSWNLSQIMRVDGRKVACEGEDLPLNRYSTPLHCVNGEEGEGESKLKNFKFNQPLVG